MNHSWYCIKGMIADKLFRMREFHFFFGIPIGCICDCHLQKLEVQLANLESALALIAGEQTRRIVG